jgi:hypothetical protein
MRPLDKDVKEAEILRGRITFGLIAEQMGCTRQRVHQIARGNCSREIFERYLVILKEMTEQ